MGVSERNRETADSLHQLFKLIDLEDFQAAYREIEMNPDIKRLGELAPEITRAKTLIKFLEGEK